MISVEQWSRLHWLKRNNFNRPDYLDWSIVHAVDEFIADNIGIVPVILSDYRPNDLDSQHSRGLAVDMYWPELDPLEVWEKARASKLFSGLGIYLNKAGVVSFHFDTRVDRTVENPALWGRFIEQSDNPITKGYVGADLVLDALKKKEWLGLTVLGIAIYLMSRRNK